MGNDWEVARGHCAIKGAKVERMGVNLGKLDKGVRVCRKLAKENTILVVNDTLRESPLYIDKSS